MISKEEVKHIASLARLNLTQEEMIKIEKELSSIISYIDQLKEVDISKAQPLTYVNIGRGKIREDKAEKFNVESIIKLVEAFSREEKGYLKVKPVFKDKK